MKEFNRTLVFLVVAAASVLAAAATHYVTRPKPISGFEQVGQDFYPEFKDPTAPKSIKVIAFDETTATIKDFEVAFENGRWRIPTHSGYPADAAKRLQETAASVIGIKRDALISRRESDHEKYGVLDPRISEAGKLQGRGQRLILSAEDGTALVDYIVGKKVENQEGYYYVRTPEDKSTYKAKLKINLSTKFSDWIETDLLQLDPEKLVELTLINKHAIDRRTGEVTDVDKSVLDRKSSSDPWKLEGLDEETEELKLDDVRTLVGKLDDLRLVGVRPKPAGLMPDLTLDPKIARDRTSSILLRETLISSLSSKGFYIGLDADEKPKLVSQEGSVQAGTNEGVVYTLHFGDIFTGSEKEIEGFSGSETNEGEKKDKEGAAESEKKGGEKKDDGEKEDEAKEGEKSSEKKDKKAELKKSRYLMVMVTFDESRLGEELDRPEKPEAPAEAPAEAETPDGKPAAGTPEDKKADPAKPEEKKSDEAKPDETKSDQPKPDAKTDAKFEYEAALAKYRRDLEQYENDVKLRSDRAEKGRKQVAQLNKRFGGWYYVISEESFDALHLSRAALVKEKEKAAAKPDDAKPGETKPDAKPGDEKPGATKPE